MTEHRVKFCPDLITREERKAIAIGTGDVVISYFNPCLAEKCTAYSGGRCFKYDNDVRIREAIMNTMFSDLTDDELSKELKDYAEHRSGEIADLTYSEGLRNAVLSTRGKALEEEADERTL